MKLKFLQWVSNGFSGNWTKEYNRHSYWDSIITNVDLCHLSRIDDNGLSIVHDYFPHVFYTKQNKLQDDSYLVIAATKDIFKNIKIAQLPSFSKTKQSNPGNGSIAISYNVNDTQFIAAHPVFADNNITNNDNLNDITSIFKNVAIEKNCLIATDFHRPNPDPEIDALVTSNNFTSHLDNLGTFIQMFNNTYHCTNLDKCLIRGNVEISNITSVHLPITESTASFHMAVSYDLNLKGE